MSGKRFEYIRGKYKHGIHDTVKDGEYRSGCRTTYDDFDLDKLTDELNIRENRIKQLEKENEQLKTTISRLIEQNRKNNDLLVSDIRLLEKALWCPNCTRNIKRLKELKKEFEDD